MLSQSRPRGLSTVANRLGTTSTNLGEVKTLLNSWKEIAAYLGRGVRTVQRWERDLGLPVRRPRNHLRSPVVAIPSELDHWVRRVGCRAASSDESVHGRVHIRAKTEELIARANANLQRTQALQEALVKTMSLIERIRRSGGQAPTAASTPNAANGNGNHRQRLAS
jgi:hypothetical protein